MDKCIGEYVKSAISLKALGVRTTDVGRSYVQIDVQELGARLKANGGLVEMMKYVEKTSDFTIKSVWEASPVSIQTLIDMRTEKTPNGYNRQT